MNFERNVSILMGPTFLVWNHSLNFINMVVLKRFNFSPRKNLSIYDDVEQESANLEFQSSLLWVWSLIFLSSRIKGSQLFCFENTVF